MEHWLKILLALILLALGIFIDVIIGIAINWIFLSLSAIAPMWLIITIIAIIDVAGIIAIWDKIGSFFSGM